MKILEQPDSTWTAVLTCERCSTKFEADQDDLEIDNFKVSGFHFLDTAVCAPKYYVYCPADEALNWVEEAEVPVLLRDKVKAVANEKRKAWHLDPIV